jgi:pimeloyl-ACP methyl ester carboxylesterase
MFRNLIPALADRYHAIAPDYPGFGQSDMPDRSKFAYTFAHLTDRVDGLLDQMNARRYALYVMDYGAPIGYRLALEHPERVTALIVQNGNAYEEGLKEFWDPIKAYWADGSAAHRKALAKREYSPPTLIVWGKNDKIFPADGAHPYRRDLPEAEFHMLDTGHFALEDKADEMVPLIRDFLSRVGPEPS